MIKIIDSIHLIREIIKFKPEHLFAAKSDHSMHKHKDTLILINFFWFAISYLSVNARLSVLLIVVAAFHFDITFFCLWRMSVFAFVVVVVVCLPLNLCAFHAGTIVFTSFLVGLISVVCVLETTCIWKTLLDMRWPFCSL